VKIQFLPDIESKKEENTFITILEPTVNIKAP
jgi:hypothetical protein